MVPHASRNAPQESQTKFVLQSDARISVAYNSWSVKFADKTLVVVINVCLTLMLILPG